MRVMVRAMVMVMARVTPCTTEEWAQSAFRHTVGYGESESEG